MLKTLNFCVILNKLNLTQKSAIMEDDNNKKSFSENAKGFFSAMKDDFTNKNKDILENKKKRDEEWQAMNQKMKDLFEEIKEEVPEKGKELFEGLKENMEKFSSVVEKGIDDLSEKYKLEEKLKKATEILDEAQDVGAEKFKKFSQEIKEKLKEFDHEDQVKKTVDDIHNQSDVSNIDDLLKDADELNTKLENKRKNNLDDLL